MILNLSMIDLMLRLLFLQKKKLQEKLKKRKKVVKRKRKEIKPKRKKERKVKKVMMMTVNLKFLKLVQVKSFKNLITFMMNGKKVGTKETKLVTKNKNTIVK